MRTWFWTMVLSALSLAGCGGSSGVTQVVLEVDTDIDFPDSLDEIRATVRNPEGETRTASAVLGFGQQEPPRTLAISHGSGSFEGYTVELDGLLRGAVVVSRALRFDMTRGEVRYVSVSLDESCVGVSCTGEETCSDAVCVAPDVIPESRSGASSVMDAGVE